MRLLKGPDGEIIGRACVAPGTGAFESAGTITIGGLRAASVAGIAGVFEGTSARAIRDVALPAVEESELKAWASEQAMIAATSFSDPHQLSECASIISACGGDIKNLPVALSSRGWLTIPDIAGWINAPDEVLLTEWNDSSRLKDNVLVVPEDFDLSIWGGPLTLARWLQPDIIFANEMITLSSNSILLSIIGALAKAWSAPLDEVLKVSDFSDDYRTIGRYRKKDVAAEAFVIRNSHKFTAGAPGSNVK